MAKTTYQQISIRIGKGREAAEYLARIDAAMKAARRTTRADWLRFVIDLALEESEALAGRTTDGQANVRHGRSLPSRSDAVSVAVSKNP